MKSSIESAYRAFCKKRFPLPSEHKVALLEKRLNIPFPPDYRDFILNYNGGFFSGPDIISSHKECPQDGLDFLNGIGATHPTAELASDEDLALFDDNDPPQILPIGYTLMGNLIFLVTHPEGQGAIGLKIAGADQSFQLGGGIEQFFALLRQPSEL